VSIYAPGIPTIPYPVHFGFCITARLGRSANHWWTTELAIVSRSFWVRCQRANDLLGAIAESDKSCDQKEDQKRHIRCEIGSNCLDGFIFKKAKPGDLEVPKRFSKHQLKGTFLMFIQMILAFWFCTQFSFDILAQTGIITTYVGPGLPINGALATTQSLDEPTSVALDGIGGIYVASSSQNRIYCVSSDGYLRLVAGSGSPGFGGDGGQATLAQLNWPNSVAVDSKGNLYIADSRNNRIRKVTPSGGINTIAGNGIAGFSGDGGQATSAQLSHPDGISNWEL
jgi:hypothetical protein